MNFKKNIEDIIISYSNLGYSLIMDNILFIATSLSIYILVSIFIMRPYVKRRSIKAIGGNVEVKSDPFIIILPGLFIVALSTFWMIITLSKS